MMEHCRNTAVLKLERTEKVRDWRLTWGEGSLVVPAGWSCCPLPILVAPTGFEHPARQMQQEAREQKAPSRKVT